MFDLIKYALDNNVAIVIDPYTEHGVIITVGTAIDIKTHATSVECGFRAATEPQDAQETCDRLLAMIGSRFAQHYANVEGSRKRAEMETYWRDGKTIIGGKEVDN